MGEGKGLTWVVKSRPAKQLGKRQHIVLQSDSKRSGVGRLTSVVEMRRHWVLFTVSGGPYPCNVRVPVPWAALDDLESFTHAKLYFTLPTLPRPHAEFERIPLFTNDEENPYEFELGEGRALDAERRYARITSTTLDMGLQSASPAEGLR